MTGLELVNMIVMPVIAILAIVWSVKNNSKNITHDNEKELWRAVHELRDDVKGNYWTSERTKEFYELSTGKWALKFEHIEREVETANKKLDLIVGNMSVKD